MDSKSGDLNYKTIVVISLVIKYILTPNYETKKNEGKKRLQSNVDLVQLLGIHRKIRFHLRISKTLVRKSKHSSCEIYSLQQ